MVQYRERERKRVLVHSVTTQVPSICIHEVDAKYLYKGTQHSIRCMRNKSIKLVRWRAISFIYFFIFWLQLFVVWHWSDSTWNGQSGLWNVISNIQYIAIEQRIHRDVKHIQTLSIICLIMINYQRERTSFQATKFKNSWMLDIFRFCEEFQFQYRRWEFKCSWHFVDNYKMFEHTEWTALDLFKSFIK